MDESNLEDRSNRGPNVRRRGAVLEDAILDAAWQELEASGYTNLTLDAVAHRAGTSRPVLRRRWPGRQELAVAALAHRLDRVPITVPDLGSVREELAYLLRRLGERSAPLIRVALNIGTELAGSGSTYADFRERLLRQIADPDLFEAVLRRGIERGEVDPEKLTPKVRALPMTLGRHDMLMTSAPPANADLYAMLDQVFLPLVRPSASPERQATPS